MPAPALAVSTASPPPPATDDLGGLSGEAITLRLLFERIGPLIDGADASIRFRRVVASPAIGAAAFAGLVCEALESPTERQARRALQDLVNAAAERLGLPVTHGPYEPAAQPVLPGAGLWQVGPDVFALVKLVRGTERLDAAAAAQDLLALPSGFPQLQQCELMLLVVTPSIRARSLARSLSRRHLAARGRVAEIESLVELVRLRESGILSAAQVEVLLAPSDTVRLGRTLDLLERFVSAACDDELPWAPRAAPRGKRAAPLQGPAAVGAGMSPREGFGARPASGPRGEALVRAFVLHRAGDREGAIAGLREYLAGAPYNLRAWELLGDLLRVAGRAQEAVEAYQQAIISIPRRDGLLTKLAQCLRTGQPADALTQSMIRTSAHGLGALDGHLALARALAATDDVAARYHAHRAMDEVRRAYAQTVDILVDTAMNRGDRAEAADLLSKAIDVLGHDPHLAARLEQVRPPTRRFRLLGF